MKKNLFWKIYGIVVVLAVACSAALLIVLWNFLSAYEKSQPKYEMDKVMELFKNDNSEELEKYITYDTNSFESSETISNYIDGILSDGQWAYTQKSETYTSDSPVYAVNKDGKAVATVSLVKSTQKGPFNMDVWEIQKVDNLLSEKEDYTITAPSNSTVYVNDIKLTEDNIVQKDIAISDLANSANYVTVPTMVKYMVSGLITKPKITAVGGVFNSELTATNENEQSVRFSFESNQDFNSTQEPRIIDITKIYGKYVINDVKFSSISPYVIESSYAYKFLKSVGSTNIWYSSHTAPEFVDLSVNNYQMYTDSCFSCDVSFTLKFTTSIKTFEYPTKLRYYFVKTNNTWYIADFVIK